MAAELRGGRVGGGGLRARDVVMWNQRGACVASGVSTWVGWVEVQAVLRARMRWPTDSASSDSRALL